MVPSIASVMGGERRTIALIGLGVVAFVVLPFVIDTTTAAEVVLLAIFALGYNILLGYGGEMSFGHAMFYGGGAYATLVFVQTWALNIWVGLALAMVVMTAFSVVIGWVSLHQRGVYFSMITIAFGQMLYFLVYAFNNITGGSNGIYLPVESTAALGPIEPSDHALTFYFVILVVLGLLLVGLRRFIDSPFGRALDAVGENEVRADHLGYNTDRIMLLGFTFSGIVASFAGGLYGLLFQFASPSILYWSQSGEVLLITVLGGFGTLGGPVTGALVFNLLDTYVSQVTENWLIVVGALFIFVVRFMPEGIWTIIKQNLLEYRETDDTVDDTTAD